MSRRARGHLLVLAALLLLLKAAGYRLAMFDLLFSERGVAFGAGWLHHLWQGTQRGRYAV